ncbi:hypothetical protein EJ06DRAFT_162466 [Trichodelitschia bisporula]|uniref:Uncharacterized protein n=1 Tax=Trichodelitschia bisporula TaxID=703511 RepID=A0A6G1HM52_9PEZI|nr:hypothetical protein EJ06DRAFT_162466 [Trichodelitschia bisporula]
MAGPKRPLAADMMDDTGSPGPTKRTKSLSLTTPPTSVMLPPRPQTNAETDDDRLNPRKEHTVRENADSNRVQASKPPIPAGTLSNGDGAHRPSDSAGPVAVMKAPEPPPPDRSQHKAAGIANPRTCAVAHQPSAESPSPTTDFADEALDHALMKVATLHVRIAQHDLDISKAAALVATLTEELENREKFPNGLGPGVDISGIRVPLKKANATVQKLKEEKQDMELQLKGAAKGLIHLFRSDRGLSIKGASAQRSPTLRALPPQPSSLSEPCCESAKALAQIQQQLDAQSRQLRELSDFTSVKKRLTSLETHVQSKDARLNEQDAKIEQLRRLNEQQSAANRHLSEKVVDCRSEVGYFRDLLHPLTERLPRGGALEHDWALSAETSNTIRNLGSKMQEVSDTIDDLVECNRRRKEEINDVQGRIESRLKLNPVAVNQGPYALRKETTAKFDEINLRIAEVAAIAREIGNGRESPKTKVQNTVKEEIEKALHNFQHTTLPLEMETRAKAIMNTARKEASSIETRLEESLKSLQITTDTSIGSIKEDLAECQKQVGDFHKRIGDIKETLAILSTTVHGEIGFGESKYTQLLEDVHGLKCKASTTPVGRGNSLDQLQRYDDELRKQQDMLARHAEAITELTAASQLSSVPHSSDLQAVPSLIAQVSEMMTRVAELEHSIVQASTGSINKPPGPSRTEIAVVSRAPSSDVTESLDMRNLAKSIENLRHELQNVQDQQNKDHTTLEGLQTQPETRASPSEIAAVLEKCQAAIDKLNAREAQILADFHAIAQKEEAKINTWRTEATKNLLSAIRSLPRPEKQASTDEATSKEEGVEPTVKRLADDFETIKDKYTSLESSLLRVFAELQLNEKEQTSGLPLLARLKENMNSLSGQVFLLQNSTRSVQNKSPPTTNGAAEGRKL